MPSIDEKEEQKDPIAAIGGVAMHHPGLANYGDHRVVKTQAEFDALVKKDPAWRQQLYTEDEIAQYKARRRK